MRLVALSVTLLVVATPARAHFDAGNTYTHRACPGALDTRVDPINVVFHGWGTWGRAVSQIEAHAGWNATTGTTQYFVDHGAVARCTHSTRAGPARDSTYSGS